jgi:hypothetical protein
MCRGVAEYSGDVDVTVLSQAEFGVFTHHTPWLLEHFDGVSQCSWMESGTGFENGCKTTWLASHGFEYEQGDKTLPFDRVLCVSDRIYEAAKGMCNAVRVVPGVEQNLFLPWELPNKDKLVVGWCGQRDGVTKGYQEVLEPLQGILGDLVEWQINTRSAQDPLGDRPGDAAVVSRHRPVPLDQLLGRLPDAGVGSGLLRAAGDCNRCRCGE